MPKKVLILGGNGMLGHKLVQVFSEHFDTQTTVRKAPSHTNMSGLFDEHKIIAGVDASDIITVRTAIESSRPDVIINAIGVIKQLPSSKDVVHTLTINSIFPHLIAGLSAEYGFRFITIGTDCVFSGNKGMYRESDIPDAVDLYGRSKQLGEVSVQENCLTLRTSIIGRELETSHSLIEWFLSQTSPVRGFANAIFSGFPTIILAELLVSIIRDYPELTGLYHLSSEPVSKFDLLSLVKKGRGSTIEIDKETEFMIDRSLDSSRFREATGFSPLPWPEMVDRMLSDPTPYDEWQKNILI